MINMLGHKGCLNLEGPSQSVKSSHTTGLDMKHVTRLIYFHPI